MSLSSEYKSKSKSGRWWVGLFAGNLTYSFVSEPDFLYVSLRERRKAARWALSQSFKHWQIWAALFFLFITTVGFSLLDMALHISDYNGTLGAGFGFLLGLTVMQWATYTFGLPYYRDSLKNYTNEAEPPNQP